MHRRNDHGRHRFMWIAAAIAIAFAAVGALIVAGAGTSAIGQVVAVLVGFLVLGAGASVALAMALPDVVRRIGGNEDWTYW